MPVTFLNLPLNIRERVYEFVWHASSAHIVHPVFKEPFGQEEPRFSEDVEPRYPPLEDEVEEEEEGGEVENEEGEDSEEEDGDWEDDGDGSDLSELVAQLKADEEAEDDGEDMSEGVDDEDEDFDSEEDDNGRRYAVESFKPLDISLLKVSRQINTKALPIFYANTTFVLDVDGGAVMKFLQALPDRARTSISSITLTGAALMSDDAPSKRAWSGQTKSPKSVGPPTMVTPLGAFLATKLPALDVVSFYFPFGGGEDYYCTWAPTELLMLLWHRKIALLNFVFLGDRVAATLKKCSGSDECYETLMGDWGEDAEINIGEHLFELKNPAPEGEYSEEFREKCQVYFAARDKFAAEIDEAEEGLIWEWGDRSLNMGSDGNVQAVVSMWMTAEGEDEEEES